MGSGWVKSALGGVVVADRRRERFRDSAAGWAGWIASPVGVASFNVVISMDVGSSSTLGKVERGTA
jgi:hypothetical protein